MDIVDAATRSRMMSAVRSRNTSPEMIVRRYLHEQGFRYRLHVRKLPGSPDLVLPKHRTVIFVHGCFWHRHEGCRYTTMPASNVEHWREKFAANVQRDGVKETQLRLARWKVIVVWECELKRSPEGRLNELVEEILR